MEIKRSEKLSGVNSSMHLKFAYANIQSELLFPHGFSPYSVLYIHIGAPVWTVLTFELKHLLLVSKGPKISRKWVTLIIPHR